MIAAHLKQSLAALERANDDVAMLATAGKIADVIVAALRAGNKLLIIGKLNFAGDSISISGRLYADLSKIASGQATILFLADIPDQQV